MCPSEIPNFCELCLKLQTFFLQFIFCSKFISQFFFNLREIPFCLKEVARGLTLEKALL